MVVAATTLGLAASGTAHATADLARKRACLACHQVDKARAGPAFIDVATRYRNDRQAEARLVNKVLKGGGGAWQMPMGPMPAQSQVSEPEARQLVKWILAQRP
ncbi:MAG: c-type cytochrome [Burkholderiales bacterium]|nr:c-type cytochrome [Burkholderiales bacterium]MBH2017613.1 c-type cytochrome [Burkholderiales bacterium]